VYWSNWLGQDIVKDIRINSLNIFWVSEWSTLIWFQ
jgi:hypothetical protein